MDLERQSPRAARLAFLDIRDSLLNVRFWMTLAWVDILQRYRGSMLGPFWLTITTAAFLAGLGPIYSLLFNLRMADYLPYLASGLIVWNFMVASVNESCSAYIFAGPVMKQVRMPRMIPVLHVVARNAIIFAHSIPLYFVVHIVFERPWHWGMLWALPGFLLLCGILINIAIILAVISVRYRDFIQIVVSVMQVGFFITPIIWQPGQRPALQVVSDVNPLAAGIMIIRGPLMDMPVSNAHLAWAIGGFAISTVLAFTLFARYRQRIIYWV